MLLLGTSLTSCKKCTVGTDTFSGDALEEISVFPSGGYMTSSMGGDYHVDATHQYYDRFEISTDAGITRTGVDYSQYSILANPATVPCEASFDRKVTINNSNMTVVYDLTIRLCKESKCTEMRSVENYVAIPAVDDGIYTIIYNQTTVEM